jgi:hypothetical protein
VPLGYEMSFGRKPIACLTVHYATRLRRSRTTMTAEGLCGIVEDAREIAGKYAEFDAGNATPAKACGFRIEESDSKRRSDVDAVDRRGAQ